MAQLHNKGLHLTREPGRVPSRSACTSRPGGGMLVAQVKPKVVIRRTSALADSDLARPHRTPPPGNCGQRRLPKRGSRLRPWPPVRRPLQSSRGAGRFRLASSARAEVRGARYGSVGLAGRHTECSLESLHLSARRITRVCTWRGKRVGCRAARLAPRDPAEACWSRR